MRSSAQDLTGYSPTELRARNLLRMAGGITNMLQDIHWHPQTLPLRGASEVFSLAGKLWHI